MYSKAPGADGESDWRRLPTAGPVELRLMRLGLLNLLAGQREIQPRDAAGVRLTPRWNVRADGGVVPH
jgi:hypothetical protein